MGHGARRLQPWRHGLGIFSARPCAIARVSLGRRRDRRHQRPPPDDLLRAGPVERARPDFERTPLRAYRQPGKSRRRREGVLLLSRLHSHAQLHADVVQISAGRISLRCAGGGKRAQGADQPEFELLDTGVFAGNRYFDVFIEYAKADVEDILIKITAVNRGPEAATLHLLPSLWFRNTWSWGRDLRRPVLRKSIGLAQCHCVELEHWQYGKRWLLCAGQPQLLFTENETNYERLFDGQNRRAVCQRRVSRICDSQESGGRESQPDRHEDGCLSSGDARPE